MTHNNQLPLFSPLLPEVGQKVTVISNSSFKGYQGSICDFVSRDDGIYCQVKLESEDSNNGRILYYQPEALEW